METDRYGAIVNTGHHKASRDDFTTPEAAAAWAREEAPKLQAQSSVWGAEWRVHRLVGSQSATQLHPSTCVRRSCDCTVKCGDDPDLPSGKADPCLHLQQRRTAERVIEERQARIAELTHALGQPGDVLAALEAGVELQSQLLQTHAAKEGAYLERNRLVAALATCYPAGTAITPIEGWAPEFCNCVFIDLPTGQASWHYHDSQAHLFAHLPPYNGTWDGHTTEEKYERVARLNGARPAVEALMRRQAVLEEGLRVVMRTLETPQEAIIDTIWAEGPAHETLYEFCSSVLGDEKPNTEANLPLLDPLSKAAAWNLVRRAARDLAPGKGISELLGAVDAFGQACEREAAQQAQRMLAKITEEQHAAACKVLLRAKGLDGTPQRMLDAMLAAEPKAETSRPKCRDCADFGPICPNDGLPCDSSKGGN